MACLSRTEVFAVLRFSLNGAAVASRLKLLLRTRSLRAI